jgi:hypothetical protein
MANVRIQLDLDERRVRELDALADQCGLGTRKELFNNALSLFEWAIREVSHGRIIASVDEAADRYKELHMPALETAAARSKETSKQEYAEAKAAAG